MEITSKIFDELYPEIIEYTLISDTLIVKIMNMGATITSIQYRNDGSDVVLGYDTIDEYKRFDNYFGATIGRCANRIKDGEFVLHGNTYKLEVNDAGNALHGGKQGFHGRLFDVNIVDNTLMMSYTSKHMEEGYPGTLDFCVAFDLQQDTLYIKYQAVSDTDTIVNFTNHSYFALQSHGKGSVGHQIVKMNANKYAENDKNRLVSGRMIKVKGTPFDFTKGKAIGEDINHIEDVQIQYANGYDHYFQFDKNEPHNVEVKDEKSHHSLSIQTDMPGFHFYVPAYNEPQKGKQNAEYVGHCALCVETSFMPDAIHVQKEPETLLQANKVFESMTSYTFR